MESNSNFSHAFDKYLRNLYSDEWNEKQIYAEKRKYFSINFKGFHIKGLALIEKNLII